MAKIGKKSMAAPRTMNAVPPHHTIAKGGIPFKYLTEKSDGLAAMLLPQMKVTGTFKRVKGMLGTPTPMRVDEILHYLNTLPVGAEFIGKHAGRRVVGVRHRVCATIEFADCRSPYLPPLPKTMF